jgi:tRNA A37 threonylcarbamoyladenosine biosynthesis protein TsaE
MVLSHLTRLDIERSQMGQAKVRGTFEQRKALAIERNEKIKEEIKQRRIQIEAARSPEERKRRSDAQMALAQLYAMAEVFKIYGR